MKRFAFLALLGAVAMAIAFSGPAGAAWDVSLVSGGSMDLGIVSATLLPSTDRTFAVTFKATNTSTTLTFQQVEFLYCYTWTAGLPNPQAAFAWNNATQRFELGEQWIKPVSSTNSYSLMSQHNIPLSFNNGDASIWQTATLNGTDSVPAISLGDFAPLVEKTFDFTIYTSPGSWGFDNTGFFVAVPEPGSLVTLAGGLLGFSGLVARKRKA